MLLLYLLIQFAMSNGNLMCMYSKYPICWESFIGRSDGQYCSGAEQTIECMKEKAIECNVTNSNLVLGMEQGLKETCQEGTQLNEAYLKHKTCVFDIPDDAVAPCYWVEMGAIQDSPLTGNADEDKLGMFKLTCLYDDQVNLCLSQKVFDTCGEEADRFYHKYKGPSNAFFSTACMGSGAASFDFVRTLLLQASTVLFALKFFKLTV